MGLRTYIPALIFTVRTICVYTARYDAQIRHHLAQGIATDAYNGLRVACDAFMAAVPPPAEGA